MTRDRWRVTFLCAVLVRLRKKRERQQKATLSHKGHHWHCHSSTQLQVSNNKRAIASSSYKAKNSKHNIFCNRHMPCRRCPIVTCQDEVKKVGVNWGNLTGQYAATLEFDLAVGQFLHIILRADQRWQGDPLDIVVDWYILSMLSRPVPRISTHFSRSVWPVHNEIQLTI